MGPSETLRGASSPEPAGQAEETGRGTTAAHSGPTHTTADREPPATAQPCSCGLCQGQEGHSSAIAIKLVSQRGPRGGSSQPVRSVKACSLHTDLSAAREAYPTPEEFFRRNIPVEPKSCEIILTSGCEARQGEPTPLAALLPCGGLPGTHPSLCPT